MTSTATAVGYPGRHLDRRPSPFERHLRGRARRRLHLPRRLQADRREARRPATTASTLEGAVAVESITIDDENIRPHLLSPDFFDAGRNPDVTFRSTEITGAADDLHGHGRARLAGHHAAGRGHRPAPRPGRRAPRAATSSRSRSRPRSTAPTTA